MATKKDKIIEWVRWGLAVLVIPLAIWGITIETDNAVQNERIADLTKHKEEHSKAVDSRLETLERTLDVQADRIKRLQTDLEKAQGMQKAITDNTLQLGKMEVKIDAVYKSLVDITQILRAP